MHCFSESVKLKLEAKRVGCRTSLPGPMEVPPLRRGFLEGMMCELSGSHCGPVRSGMGSAAGKGERRVSSGTKRQCAH